jgi:hypothetical protein
MDYLEMQASFLFWKHELLKKSYLYLALSLHEYIARNLCLCLWLQHSMSFALTDHAKQVHTSATKKNFSDHVIWCQEEGLLSGVALGYGLDDRGSRVRFPSGAGNFSLHHRVQNGSGALPTSYPMGTRGSLPGGNAAGAWSWPLTFIYCRGQDCVELYLHSPNTSSLRGAQLKHRDNFTFSLPLNNLSAF